MKKLLLTSICVAVLSSVVAQELPQGALPGEFTINEEGDKVIFSMGNLAYDSETDAFAFTSSQTDFGSYFGWGTSGYHDSADLLNTHYLPTDDVIAYNASQTDNITGYGPSSVGTYQPDIRWNAFDANRYANYDWGIFNPITNGGNQPGIWRTLTQDEWIYVLTHHQLAWDTINLVPGLQITADDSIHTVFLPAAGYRGLANKEFYTNVESGMHEVNEHCNYWTASASEFGSMSAIAVDYAANVAIDAAPYNRFNGFSVRLVCDAPTLITIAEQDNNEPLLANYLQNTTGKMAGKLTNVHLLRTFYYNEWTTICLPFSLTENQFKSVFGDTPLYTFANAELSNDNTELQIHLQVATELEAGVPYICKPTADIVNPDFYNCIIKTTAAAGENTPSGDEVKCVGTINACTLSPAEKRYLFVSADDELTWSTDTDAVQVYGLQAYFYVPESVLGTAQKARLVIPSSPYPTAVTSADTDAAAVKVIINGHLYILHHNTLFTLQGLPLD